MRVLFDTNVLLDVLLPRPPYSFEGEVLFDAVASEKIDGVIHATSLTNVHYLASKLTTSARAKKGIEYLLTLFEIAPVTRGVVESALGSRFDDFEDAILHEAGVLAGCTAIVTRNKKDFGSAALSIYSPADLISELQQGFKESYE